MRVSRVLRANQLTKLPPEYEIILERDKIKEYIGALDATGKNTSALSGLYSYIRKGGGAGFQGFHSDPTFVVQVVYAVLDAKKGGVVVMIDTEKVPAESAIYDLRDDKVRAEFEDEYSKYWKMYSKLEGENVGAIKGSVPVDAISALVYIPSAGDYRTFYKLIMRAYGALHRGDIDGLMAEWNGYQKTKTLGGGYHVTFS